MDSKHILPQRKLLWRYAAGKDTFGYAVRESHFKLVHYAVKNRNEFFNLLSDPFELHDLAAQEPEKVAQRTATYEHWAKEMQPPLWLDSQGRYIRYVEATLNNALEHVSRGKE